MVVPRLWVELFLLIIVCLTKSTVNVVFQVDYGVEASIWMAASLFLAASSVNIPMS